MQIAGVRIRVTSKVASVTPNAEPKLSSGDDKIWLPNMSFISRLGICKQLFSNDFSSQTVTVAVATTVHTKPSKLYTPNFSSGGGVSVGRTKPSDSMATNGDTKG